MIMDSKALNFNIDKSTYLLIGKKKNIERIRSEIEKNPLIYKDNVVKEKTTEKWLGSSINAAGLKESTISTIKETISIIEDSRLNCLGALKCAKEIWELAIIPTLLNNAEIFSVEDLKVFKILEDFQSKFWRGILSLPKSCPLPALTYESNSMLMKYRVYNKIMNFAKHIFSQNDDTLCKQVMNEQIKNNWSGLSSKASKICEELNVAGLYDSNIRKKEFKVNVKKACAQMNENQLKEQISSYKKWLNYGMRFPRETDISFQRISNLLELFLD